MDIKTYLGFWLKGNFLRKSIVTDKVESLKDFNIETIIENNIRLAVFDFDDTLSDFHGESISNDIASFLNELDSNSIKVAIYSNCSDGRNKVLFEIFEGRNYFISSQNGKPSPNGYIEILNHYNLKPEDAAMFGDKLGTDIYGAYLTGFKLRVLLKPYSYIFGGNIAPFKDRFVRRVEKLFITH
ncbi:MAG: HAD-IA family hydrolase [Candidatus Dojkabacteria bacterium]|nr:HAD-IA family hydrolase [Candidatus Dojkabacteria bacterium]MDQ7020601.1 HAD-IA family hydrolase [Candidatus Dojkabacteria bacterium]